jgi:sulfite exporter TauE/SafE
MSAQSIDLPTTSTVGGKLIATENFVNNTIGTYLGIVSAIFILILGIIIYVLFKRNMWALYAKIERLEKIIDKLNNSQSTLKSKSRVTFADKN